MSIDWNGSWDSILQQIRPTQDDLDRCQAAITTVENVLAKNWEHASRVTGVSVGGSYAKGTLLKGHLEVDVVVTVDGSCAREDYLDSFRKFIGTRWNINDAHCTRHSVHFKQRSTKVDVDLVFTYAMQASTAFAVFQSRQQFQRHRGGKRSRHATDFDLLRDSSANVTQQQVALIEGQPQSTKDIICLAKALKDRFFKPTHTYLPSYVVEIAVLNVLGVHPGRSRRRLDIDSTLVAVFETLRDLDSEVVRVMSPAAARHWVAEEDVDSYWRGSGAMCRGALVVDPENPLMNVAKMVNAAAVRERAEALLGKVWSYVVPNSD